MPSSTNPVLTQSLKKQAPSDASIKKPSDRVAVAKPATPQSSTQVSMHPMTRALAMKSSASPSAGNVARSAASSNKQNSKRSTFSGPARASIDFGWREPKPVYLPIGLGPGEFLPSGFLRLPPGCPTIKEMMAQAEADAKKSAANANKLAANPVRMAAKPTKVAANPTRDSAKPKMVATNHTKVAAMATMVATNPPTAATNSMKIAAKPTQVAAKPTTLAARPAAQSGKK